MPKSVTNGSVDGFVRRMISHAWLRTAFLTLLCLAIYLPGQTQIPPVDRDEARFVQASRQMVQSGDYVDIRFQDHPRYNKPIGMYWLQAASVRLCGAVNEIWAYRFPSWVGATVAVVATASLTMRLFGSAAGMLAGVFLASSVLLSVEAHLAKADAVLLALVVIAQAVLGRLYVERTLNRGSALLFWVALGAGILVKGPIILLLVALTIGPLAAWDRRIHWLAPLRPVAGMVAIVAITAPWLLAITARSGARFWVDSLAVDFAAKVVAAQESHGAPPGYYLFTVFVTLWPWSPLLLPAGWFAWMHRNSASTRFLVAWVLPSWIAFELVPTKLPHYTLPVFPALAGLMAGAVVHQDLPDWIRRVVRWHFLTLATAVTSGIVATILWLKLASPATVSIGACVAIGVGLLGWVVRQNKAALLAVIIGTFLIPLYAVVFGWLLPGAGDLWVSRSAAALIEEHRGDAAKPVIALGYTEPSLVFLLGAKTVLEPDGETGIRDVRQRMSDAPDSLVLIEAERLPELKLPVEELGRVHGINYSKGRRVELLLVRLRDNKTQAP